MFSLLARSLRHSRRTSKRPGFCMSSLMGTVALVGVTGLEEEAEPGLSSAAGCRVLRVRGFFSFLHNGLLFMLLEMTSRLMR